jgi:hypothetical protein
MKSVRWNPDEQEFVQISAANKACDLARLFPAAHLITAVVTLCGWIRQQSAKKYGSQGDGVDPACRRAPFLHEDRLIRPDAPCAFIATGSAELIMVSTAMAYCELAKMHARVRCK